MYVDPENNVKKVSLNHFFARCINLSVSVLPVGSLCGLVAGITATLSAATMYDGGLDNFLINTVQDYAILAGTCSSFGFSLGGCIIGSLLTHNIRSEVDAQGEWMKMYDIDNPLHPWEVNFREDLKGRRLCWGSFCCCCCCFERSEQSLQGRESERERER